MNKMEQVQQLPIIKHFPALLKEFIEVFKDSQIQIFFDATLGAAGHAIAILEEHPEINMFIGFDQDKEALDIANANLKRWMDKVKLINANFRNLDKVLDEMEIKSCDAMFFDLGASSMQFDSSKRGFSFRFDAALDMRMNRQNPLTAKEIVNSWPQDELERIFRDYGEERKFKKAARQIVELRKKRIINTTFELIEILRPVLGRAKRIHPATKIFQALRICVNDELNALKEGLKKAIERLSEDGLIAVISFHSLEDRIVKHMFRDEKRLKVITKKPVRSAADEKNKRARGAKMRVAKKINSL